MITMHETLYEWRSYHSTGPGTIRNNIRIGTLVRIAEKINYRNGKLTEGKVVRILTKKKNHPCGIKVLLDNGKIGRVQEIVEDRQTTKDNR